MLRRHRASSWGQLVGISHPHLLPQILGPVALELLGRALPLAELGPTHELHLRVRAQLLVDAWRRFGGKGGGGLARGGGGGGGSDAVVDLVDPLERVAEGDLVVVAPLVEDEDGLARKAHGVEDGEEVGGLRELRSMTRGRSSAALEQACGGARQRS